MGYHPIVYPIPTSIPFPLFVKKAINGLHLSKKYIPSAKHIHGIYLTLLSTTCVKIQRIPYVIFETISQFSRHNSPVSF